MASVASGGQAARMAARIRFRVPRAGSGTPVRYSSTVFGLRDFAFISRSNNHSFLKKSDAASVKEQGGHKLRCATEPGSFLIFLVVGAGRTFQQWAAGKSRHASLA